MVRNISPGCHLSTAQLEEFMQVVPNSGKASLQIISNIYSCLNMSADLTLKSMSSHHLFHFVRAICVHTGLCQDVHAGARTEGGQQPCWLPQIFLQLWFDRYVLRVNDNIAVKRKCSLQTPHISASRTGQFVSRVPHSNPKNDICKQINKQTNYNKKKPSLQTN